MSDVPDEIMDRAWRIYERLTIQNQGRAMGIVLRLHDAELIARALMAAAKEADEAATKRERERCISVVRGISDRHTLAASSCHLDGEKDAAALASYCARSIDDIAAIFKGEA